jgi:hypothetical protein
MDWTASSNVGSVLCSILDRLTLAIILFYYFLGTFPAFLYFLKHVRFEAQMFSKHAKYCTY